MFHEYLNKEKRNISLKKNGYLKRKDKKSIYLWSKMYLFVKYNF